MSKISMKKYLSAVGGFTILSVLCKIAFDYADRLVGEFALLLKILSLALLVMAVINLGYLFFKKCNEHDEFIRYTIMKGACFGGFVTGALSWLYWCLGSAVPQYQADWPFYMLLVFTAIGQFFFFRKAS